MSEQKIIVPNIGDFKEVEVIEVLVKEGQEIKKEDSVITLESDKSSVEVPSNFSGIIKKIDVKVGDKVSEGTTILSLDNTEDNKVNAKIIPKNENEIIDFPKVNKKREMKLASLDTKGEIKPASPNVRKFIRELGADISQIPGSERSGRITKDDVKDYIKDKFTENQNTTVQTKKSTKN